MESVEFLNLSSDPLILDRFFDNVDDSFYENAIEIIEENFISYFSEL